jgi:hypothetical protein
MAFAKRIAITALALREYRRDSRPELRTYLDDELAHPAEYLHEHEGLASVARHLRDETRRTLTLVALDSKHYAAL